MTNAWDQIKQNLSSKLSSEAFQNWFAPTTGETIDGDRITVTVPNTATKEWVEGEYADCIRNAIRELQLPVRTVEFSVTGQSEVSSANQALGDSFFQSSTVQLNPRFTFENFVVGSCNQFAHAAAQAVATMPSKSYNPLFIYGGVGMGKTHLIHAVGRLLSERFAGMRIVYTTSEKFMNQMIHCIKLDRMPHFHQYFRSADVLLVDDVQVLGGKERTQEEFFHTFNELYDHQKQIVISSDSSPKEISGLVERLRSRFEWGLMVDVQPPDLETKMAILDKKAEQEGIHLAEDVRIFIATKTKSNVRELEGALVKLLAYSSVTKTEINLSMAQQVLRHLLQGSDKRVTIETIIRAVADKFSLQPAQLRMKTNQRQIAYPRQIAMYLAKELTQASLPEIGRAFSGKHHTTVLHSVTKIEQQRQKDPDLNRMIHQLIDTIS
ncbi:MAG TPA: chromosomal replication initiator protein DnaA [Bryobacteraceae bacterium]|nr:chromosomal replication initiator protein DnaA [Bryobacteraceae bacterium]